MGVEFFGMDVVEQTPELAGVVLNRGSSQQKNSLAGHPFQSCKYLGIFVFEAVSLVDYDVLEGKVGDDIGEVEQEDLIARDEDLELVQFGGDSGAPHGDVVVVPLVVLDAATARLPVLVVVQNAVHGSPLLHRPLPVLERGERSDYQEGPLGVFEVEEMVEEGNGLDGLAQPHLVSQDGVSLLVPVLDEPVHALNLVGPQDLVVLVDVGGFLLVLVRLFLVGHVVEVQTVLYLSNLGIRKL